MESKAKDSRHSERSEESHNTDSKIDSKDVSTSSQHDTMSEIATICDANLATTQQIDCHECYAFSQ